MTAEGVVIDAHGEEGKLLFGCRQRGGGEISGGLWLPCNLHSSMTCSLAVDVREAELANFGVWYCALGSGSRT